jgi:monoamine oxidase
VDADVCVVGAGYAGLTTARHVRQAGASVIVLEARDRVGGRVWTEPAPDGTPIDMGGTWLGPGQDSAYALVADTGGSTYPTWNEGETVFARRDSVKRFGGLVPPINPIALASLSLGMARLDAMAKRVPLDEPWTARRAKAWDSRSAGQWVDTATLPSAEGQGLLGAAVRGLMTCDPSEVSLLDLLYLIRSANGLNRLLSVKDGYQQDRVTGGAQTMAHRISAELGDSLVLERPVRDVTQDDHGVVVRADGCDVRARRVVVAIPPTLAGHISYEPQLPVDRLLLAQSMPAGSIRKASVVYEEPFWRADGLNGQSVATASPIEMTLDASPVAGAGVLAAFAFGPHGRALGAREPDERRRVVLETLTMRFGPRASRPIHYEEIDWAEEPWTRGCSMAHTPPGVLTQFGPALRTPVGRIHWAGTETATVSLGTIDGAIRSGKRAAAEVLTAD